MKECIQTYIFIYSELQNKGLGLWGQQSWITIHCKMINKYSIVFPRIPLKTDAMIGPQKNALGIYLLFFDLLTRVLNGFFSRTSVQRNLGHYTVKFNERMRKHTCLYILNKGCGRLDIKSSHLAKIEKCACSL